MHWDDVWKLLHELDRFMHLYWTFGLMMDFTGRHMPGNFAHQTSRTSRYVWRLHHGSTARTTCATGCFQQQAGELKWHV
jgi:hypothetical protein